jgi:hypothetical protein
MTYIMKKIFLIILLGVVYWHLIKIADYMCHNELKALNKLIAIKVVVRDLWYG